MADTTKGASALPTLEEVQKLRMAVLNMDGFSQEGFSEIAAIARLALKSLEIPSTYCQLETIADALRAIWNKANSIQAFINSEAVDIGCDHKDAAQIRRLIAQDAARKGGAQ